MADLRRRAASSGGPPFRRTRMPRRCCSTRTIGRAARHMRAPPTAPGSSGAGCSHGAPWPPSSAATPARSGSTRAARCAEGRTAGRACWARARGCSTCRSRTPANASSSPSRGAAPSASTSSGSARSRISPPRGPACSLPRSGRCSWRCRRARGAAFFGYWTRKEALLKATGQGLAIEPATVHVTPPGDPAALLAGPRPLVPERVHLRDLDAGAGYAACLALLCDGAPAVVEDATPVAWGAG